MTTRRVRAMRGDGQSLRKIAHELNASYGKICRILYSRSGPQPDDRRVVRQVPFNGGSSMGCGYAAVSVPRITMIDGAAA